MTSSTSHSAPDRVLRLGHQPSSLVEFIGIPGAGKSTLLASALAAYPLLRSNLILGEEMQAMVQRHYVGASPGVTAALSLPFALRHPVITAGLTLHTRGSSDRPRHRRRLATITQRVRATRRFQNVSPGMVIAPDEWILHELLLARLEAGRQWTSGFASLVASVMSLASLRLEVLHVTADIDSVVDRLGKRYSASYFDALEPGILRSVLGEYQSLAEECTRTLVRGGVSVRVCDSGSPDALAVVRETLAAAATPRQFDL